MACNDTLRLMGRLVDALESRGCVGSDAQPTYTNAEIDNAITFAQNEIDSIQQIMKGRSTAHERNLKKKYDTRIRELQDHIEELKGLKKQ